MVTAALQLLEVLPDSPWDFRKIITMMDAIDRDAAVEPGMVELVDLTGVELDLDMEELDTIGVMQKDNMRRRGFRRAAVVVDDEEHQVLIELVIALGRFGSATARVFCQRSAAMAWLLREEDATAAQAGQDAAGHQFSDVS
ncbi:MAG: hypothetical protein ACOCYN_02155 [Planctomycetota bacterium]